MSSNSVTTRGSFSASITAASIDHQVGMVDLCHDVDFLTDDHQKIRLPNNVMQTFHCYPLSSKCTNPQAPVPRILCKLSKILFSWDLPEVGLVRLHLWSIPLLSKCSYLLPQALFFTLNTLYKSIFSINYLLPKPCL